MFARRGPRTSAPCRQPSTTGSGHPATRHEAACASRRCRRIGRHSPTCGPATTAPPRSSAWNWRPCRSLAARHLGGRLDRPRQDATICGLHVQPGGRVTTAVSASTTRTYFIAAVNLANAGAATPRRSGGFPTWPPWATAAENQPAVEGRIRRCDCSQMTDWQGGHGAGRAAAIQTSQRRRSVGSKLGTPTVGLGRSGSTATPGNLISSRIAVRSAGRLRPAPDSTSTASTASGCATASPGEYLAVDPSD